MPQGFKQYDKNDKPRVLKLNQTLYGLRQSPRAFWLYLTEKLEQCGLMIHASSLAVVSFVLYTSMICYSGAPKKNKSMSLGNVSMPKK